MEESNSKSNVINIKQIQKFIKSLTSICNKKSVDSTFNNFKIEFHQNKTIWFATDTEISYFFVDENVSNEVENTFVINAKIFSNFIKKTKSKEVYIQEKTRSSFILSDGKNSIIIKSFAGSFPQKSTDNFQKIFTFFCKTLSSIIESSKLNINEQNDGKFSLKVTKDAITFWSRDNRRLSVSEYKNESTYEFYISLRLIVIDKILELCDSYDEIYLYQNINTSEYMIHSENEYIIFKALTKDSIDYKSIVSVKDYECCQCELKETRNVADLATMLQTKFNHTAALYFNPSKQVFSQLLSAETYEENKILLKIEEITSAKFVGQINIQESSDNLSSCPHINVNINYLVDVLKIIQTEELSIFVSKNSQKPLIIKPTNTPGMNITHVIMPTAQYN